MYWNKLGFLSLLSLVGFLGFPTENKGFFGFFGFFAYVVYFKILPDELFWQNVQKAATLAFFCQMLSLIPICFGALLLGWEAEGIAPIAFAAAFCIGIVVFSFYLTWMEWKEQRCR